MPVQNPGDLRLVEPALLHVRLLVTDSHSKRAIGKGQVRGVEAAQCRERVNP
jgi:hypothetical protein